MTNEQIVVVRQIALISLLVAAVIVLLFYVYWHQVKSIGLMFKSGVVALLIGIGIIDEVDNNNNGNS